MQTKYSDFSLTPYTVIINGQAKILAIYEKACNSDALI